MNLYEQYKLSLERDKDKIRHTSIFFDDLCGECCKVISENEYYGLLKNNGYSSPDPTKVEFTAHGYECSECGCREAV